MVYSEHHDHQNPDHVDGAGQLARTHADSLGMFTTARRRDTRVGNRTRRQSVFGNRHLWLTDGLAMLMRFYPGGKWLQAGRGGIQRASQRESDVHCNSKVALTPRNLPEGAIAYAQ